MKAVIMYMCILSHKKQCFVDVRTCCRRRRGQTEGFARKHTTEKKMVMTGGWFMIVVPTSYHMDIMDNMDTIGGWIMVRWWLDRQFLFGSFWMMLFLAPNGWTCLRRKRPLAISDAIDKFRCIS